MKKVFRYLACACVALMAIGCTTDGNEELQQMVGAIKGDLPMAVDQCTMLVDLTVEDSCVRYKYNVIDTAGLVTSIGKNHDGILLNFSQSLSESQFKNFAALVASSDKSIVYSYNEVKTGATADVTITADEIRQMLAAAEK